MGGKISLEGSENSVDVTIASQRSVSKNITLQLQSNKYNNSNNKNIKTNKNNETKGNNRIQTKHDGENIYNIQNYRVTGEEIIMAVKETSKDAKKISTRTAEQEVTKQLIKDNLLLCAGDAIKNKRNDVIRIYYNNCNSLAVTNLNATKIKKQRDKKQKKYIGEVNDTIKTEQMLEKIFEWDFNIACLSETCTAWELTTARKVIQQVTNQFDKKVCWTTSTSSAKNGSIKGKMAIV